MSPRAALVAGAVLVAALAGAYVQGRRDGRELAAAAAEREQLVATRAADAAASAAAAAINRIEVKHVHTRQKLEREVREVPVYRDCRATADGVRRVNAALADPSAGAVDGSGVPSADAAER